MSIYSEPRDVRDQSECYFYHTMDLPGIGRIEGNWDLHPKLNEYLGNVRFGGRRVLDVGCANGILSFHMEKQGAEVVSFDLDKNQDWDIVPFAKWDQFEHIAADRKAIINRLNNAYWLAHNLLKSKAKVVYGSVYAIPAAIGPVDIAVYGAILLHLRDPFLALQNGLKLTTRTVIVTEGLRGQRQATSEPFLGLLPDSKTIEPKDTWWDIRPEWVTRAIAILGFEEVKVSYHTQKYEGRDIPLYTVVGNRTHGHV
jgi:SAM-dependent methyltransferase